MSIHTSKILCLTCNKPLVYCGQKRQKKFCSQSCAATYNNRGVARNKSPDRFCIRCNINKIPLSNKKFCSTSCWEDYSYVEKENKFLEGEVIDISIKSAKKTLLKLKGRNCWCCGLAEWVGNPIPLDIHHIDGNHKNNKLDNLQILCKNCHAQTDTYGNKKRQC